MNPDVVLTHRADDAHQDHREVSRLTWNTFRDHLVLEYEIPKWDGDLGRPNLYVPLQAGILERKIELLLAHFGTQRSKDWFDAETFRGLSRLRGMECRSEGRYAEAFFAKKVTLG
jgi:LmbE family N-acetylglucosaminyl deacetylase